jgi:hypothetical protein
MNSRQHVGVGDASGSMAFDLWQMLPESLLSWHGSGFAFGIARFRKIVVPYTAPTQNLISFLKKYPVLGTGCLGTVEKACRIFESV